MINNVQLHVKNCLVQAIQMQGGRCRDPHINQGYAKDVLTRTFHLFCISYFITPIANLCAVFPIL